MKSIGVMLAVLAFGLSAHAGGDGSDGHTHAAPVSVVPVPVSTALARISTQTEQFELVGVLEGQVLKLYLDQFATNVPVIQAQIEVESGAWKAVATEVSPAVYTVAAEPLARPGKHPLTITVQAGDSADLMEATLDSGPVMAGVVRTHFWSEWAVWAGAGALLLAGLSLVVLRRRQKRQKN